MKQGSLPTHQASTVQPLRKERHPARPVRPHHVWDLPDWLTVLLILLLALMLLGIGWSLA